MVRIAIETVVHDRHIRTRDEDADSTVVECLQDVGNDKIAAIKEVVNRTASKTPNGTTNKNDNGPARNMTDHFVIHFFEISAKHFHDRCRFLYVHVGSIRVGQQVVIDGLQGRDQSVHYVRGENGHVR